MSPANSRRTSALPRLVQGPSAFVCFGALCLQPVSAAGVMSPLYTARSIAGVLPLVHTPKVDPSESPDPPHREPSQ
jgi:hypothetical protein